MNLNIMLVPTEFVPHEFPRVYDMLKPAVDRSGGRWTMKDLLQALCLGHQNLWIVRDDEGECQSALTVQVVDYPSSRMLAVQFLGGVGFDEWSDGMLEMLENFAYDSGCTGIEAVGRFGFWPFFKRHGYSKAFCTYQKDFPRTQI